MKSCVAITVVLAFAAGATPLARGAEEQSTTLARSRRASELLAGIEAEFAIDRAIFEEELDRGVALGQWSQTENAMALSSMRSLLGTDDRAFSRPYEPPGIRTAMIERAGTTGDPSQPTTPLRRWYAQRIAALRALREKARAELVSTALECAEEAWLKAENRADLEPAIRQLNEAKPVVADSWTQVLSLRRSSFGPPSMPGYERPEVPLPLRQALAVFDFLTVLASPEPFFLPDPARDPGAYKTGRMLWSGLVEIDHTFTRWPAIVARYRDYEDRLFDFQQTQRAALDALIIRDAPASEFEPLYLRYTPAALPRRPYENRSFGFRHDALSAPNAPVPDYRQLLPNPQFSAPFNRNPRPLRLGAPLAPVEELQAYGDWLAFRKAEEQGNAAAIRAAREKVIKSRGRLQRQPFFHIGTRLGLDGKPASVAPAAPDPAAQPVDALLAQLRGIVAQDETHASARRQVITAWEKLRAGADLGTTAPHAKDFWAGLAARPGSRSLFALRDQAARQLLAQFLPAAAGGGISTTPLPADLRRHLADSIARGTSDSTKQLLAIDAAAAILPDVENRDWARDSELLSTAANLAKAGERQAARTAYLQAIPRLASPALGEFAALTAKALSEKQP